jgi:hypothetical protein
MSSPAKFTTLESAFVTYATRMQTASPAAFEELKEKIVRITNSVETMFKVIEDRSQYLLKQLEQQKAHLKEMEDEDPAPQVKAVREKYKEYKAEIDEKKKIYKAAGKTKKAYEKFVQTMKQVTSLKQDHQKDIKILKETIISKYPMSIGFISDCLRSYKHQHTRLARKNEHTANTQTELQSKLINIITWVNSFQINLNEILLLEATTDAELRNTYDTHLKGFKKRAKGIQKLKEELGKIRKEATKLLTDVTSVKIIATPSASPKPAQAPVPAEMEILRTKKTQLEALTKFLTDKREVLCEQSRAAENDEARDPISKQLQTVCQHLLNKNAELETVRAKLATMAATMQNGVGAADLYKDFMDDSAWDTLLSRTEAQPAGGEPARAESPVVDAWAAGSPYFNSDISL